MSSVKTFALVDGCYVEDTLGLPLDDSGDDFSLLAYAREHCTLVECTVELAGVRLCKTLFVDKNDVKTAFLIGPKAGEAPDADCDQVCDAEIATSHAAAFATSEAISDEYAVQVWPFYFQPTISAETTSENGELQTFNVQPTDLLAKRRAIIFGEPGSGKTTLLRHLCHELLNRGRSQWYDEQRIPIYIPIRSFRGGSGDLSEVQSIVAVTGGERLASCVAELANEGRLVFLFDGIDEANYRYRRKLLISLREFVN
jgi:hypothetical protein